MSNFGSQTTCRGHIKRTLKIFQKLNSSTYIGVDYKGNAANRWVRNLVEDSTLSKLKKQKLFGFKDFAKKPILATRNLKRKVAFAWFKRRIYCTDFSMNDKLSEAKNGLK